MAQEAINSRDLRATAGVRRSSFSRLNWLNVSESGRAEPESRAATGGVTSVTDQDGLSHGVK